jgi:hypothetical protein
MPEPLCWLVYKDIQDKRLAGCKKIIHGLRGRRLAGELMDYLLSLAIRLFRSTAAAAIGDGHERLKEGKQAAAIDFQFLLLADFLLFLPASSLIYFYFIDFCL